MFEQFDIDDKNIFKVCVVATMSSGKSTFINSIIGEEIMPEKNEACTARTMSVIDNDNATTKKAHIIRQNGAKEVVEIDSKDVLDRINNDEDIKEFLIETDIESIKNTSRALVLVDTPGVNNSGDEKHGKRTEEFLQKMDMGVIIYLLNATQLATNDDSILLELVSDHVKKNKNVKIMFVINKIDALDEESESISDTVKVAKEYIEGHGVKNPIIYPLSALAAKSLRMVLYKREMTKRELRRLGDIYDRYQPKDNSMLAYAMTDELSSEVYTIDDKKVSAEQLKRALDNTGITAIERRLESYMMEIEQHYSPEIVIKTQLSQSSDNLYHKRIVEISKYKKTSKDVELVELKKEVLESPSVHEMNLFAAPAESVINKDLSENEVCQGIDSLLTCIEKTKKDLLGIFEDGNVPGLGTKSSFYLFPEMDEQKSLHCRELFWYSYDKKNWKEINYSELYAKEDASVDVFFCNKISAEITQIVSKDISDVISILDTRVPFTKIQIAGLVIGLLPMHAIDEHVQKLNAKAADEKEAAKAAEEVLKKTYKGIVFSSEAEKNKVINLEREIAVYCDELETRSYAELRKRKKEISDLPNTIFGQFVSNLAIAMDITEKKELSTYIDRISAASLNELSVIKSEIRKQEYSSESEVCADKAIEQRKLVCERELLDETIKEMTSLDRKQLKELYNVIDKKPYNRELITEYLSTIQHQSDYLEEKELRELCSNIEEKDIASLNSLLSEINKGNYQNRFSDNYYNLIESRLDFLHVLGMEAICKNIEFSNREAVLSMKNSIDKEPCKAELKGKYYAKIAEREEQLDYEDLCKLTCDLEDKSLSELEEIERKLTNDSFNEKFVKEFQLKVRVAKERSQYNHLCQITSGLAQMTKPQVIEIKDMINQLGYPNRIRFKFDEAILERIYEIELMDLVSKVNDFDSLTLSQIADLRNTVQQQNLLARTKDIYCSKLREREWAIACKMVSPYACLMKMCIEQGGGDLSRFVLATFDARYDTYYKQFIDQNPEDISDIPIMFIPDMNGLAFSKKYVYYQKAGTYVKHGIDEIRSFSSEKKFLSEIIYLTLNNNAFISFPSKGKAGQTMVNILHAYLQNRNNQSYLAQFATYDKPVEPFNQDNMNVHKIYLDLSINTMVELLQKELQHVNVLTGFQTILSSNWSNLERKVINGFEIQDDCKILAYYDRTFFNSAKEGFALGTEKIYIKNSNQPLISISYKELFSMKYDGAKLYLDTIQNHIFMVDISVGKNDTPDQFINILDSIAKGIQLLTVECSKNVETVSKSESEEFIKCGSCGAMNKKRAKFCSTCGNSLIPTVIEEEPVEYVFCSECGNKCIKGKKFCSRCGSPLGQ